MIEQLASAIPDHAKDVRINLGAIAQTGLTPQQAWMVAVASAAAARQPDVLAAVRAEAVARIAPEAVGAALAAASVMAMTNVYYRFVHVMGEDSEYARMPARLRMQVLGKPGVDHVDFELASLAASAIAGCERCMRAHEASVRERGGTTANVHDAVRIAAIVHGAAVAVGT